MKPNNSEIFAEILYKVNNKYVGSLLNEETLSSMQSELTEALKANFPKVDYSKVALKKTSHCDLTIVLPDEFLDVLSDQYFEKVS